MNDNACTIFLNLINRQCVYDAYFRMFEPAQEPGENIAAVSAYLWVISWYPCSPCFIFPRDLFISGHLSCLFSLCSSSFQGGLLKRHFFMFSMAVRRAAYIPERICSLGAAAVFPNVRHIDLFWYPCFRGRLLPVCAVLAERCGGPPFSFPPGVPVPAHLSLRFLWCLPWAKQHFLPRSGIPGIQDILFLWPCAMILIFYVMILGNTLRSCRRNEEEPVCKQLIGARSTITDP